MPAIQKTFMSESGYLEEERKALTKSEFYKGEVYAMSGASKNHHAITATLIGELYAFLKGKFCNVYPSDLRVHYP